MQTSQIADGHTVSRHSIVDPHVKENNFKDHEAIEMPRMADHGLSPSDSRAISLSDSDLKARTKRQRLRARVQFATLCWVMYLAGWNDGTTGPLLPRIQKVYNVRALNTCSISEIDLPS